MNAENWLCPGPLSVPFRRMRSAKIMGILVAAALAFSGCETVPKIKTEAASNLNPGSYRTYTIQPFLGEPTRESAHRELIRTLRPQAEQAVHDTLGPKGYVLAESPSSADLVVVISGKLTPKSIVLMEADRLSSVSYAGTPPSSSLNRNTPGVIHRNDFNEGHLRVEVHDRKTDRMVWVSWFDRDVRSVEQLDATRIAGNVGRILAGFPARP